ncbi:response regulator [Zeimonas arvi]|nr:response regulator [Zeimonas arvi]
MSSTARSAVVLYDSQLRITGMNRAASRLLGGPEWIGRPLPDCLAAAGAQAANSQAGRLPDLAEHARAGMSFMLGIGTRAWRAEVSSLDTGPASEPGAPLTAPGALVLREAGDVDDYRDLALETLDPRSAIAHDLRTPLNAMAGWLHLLSSPQPRPPEATARAIEGLRRAVEQQRKLIEERLDRPAPAAAGDAPAARPDGAKARPGGAKGGDADGAPETGLRGCFVLAVDDHAELLDMLSEVLAADGASVVTTESVDQALAIYPRWAAGGGERLLVSDLAMPGRDGFSLIREIRALERAQGLPRLPAVALSAHGMADVRRRAILNGFDLFVDKPIDPPAMLERLRRLLDR